MVLVALRHRAVNEDGGDVFVEERLALIRDETEEGRDDDGDSARLARLDDGRELVAEALAATGREEDEDVPATERRIDRFLLVLAEADEAEPLPQNLVDVLRPRVISLRSDDGGEARLRRIRRSNDFLDSRWTGRVDDDDFAPGRRRGLTLSAALDRHDDGFVVFVVVALDLLDPGDGEARWGLPPR